MPEQTLGVHPKVKIPATGLAAIGVVLVALGFLLGEDNLKQEGLSAIAASGVTSGLGFLAPAGQTVGGAAEEADPSPGLGSTDTASLPQL